jgi:hypothetical protein
VPSACWNNAEVTGRGTMASHKRLLGIMLISGFLAAAVAACSEVPSTPTLTPTVPADVPSQVVAARDAALGFLRQRYLSRAPAAGVGWTGRNTNPPDVPGLPSYEFTSGDWVMTIWVPAISVHSVIYEMRLDNAATGFYWTGKLGEDLTVLESNLNVNFDVLVVRDLVLAYFRENYSGDAPSSDLVWVGERTTPEGSVDHEWCQFTADGWSLLVDYEVTRPEQVLFQVELRDADSGLVWWCQVDAEGQILEIQRLAE